MPDMDRRSFLGGVAAVGIGARVGGDRDGAVDASLRGREADGGDRTVLREAMGAEAASQLADRFDPWVQIHPEAIAHNVGVVRRLTGDRPILAVVKNNAYGVGLAQAARLLGGHDAIAGFAVVKPEDAIALRESGTTLPVLLMGMAPDDAVRDLVDAGVHLSLYLDDDARRIPARAGRARAIPAHVYLDTGMSRMGMPWHRALPWLEGIHRSGAFRLTGTFMAFTEDADFDREQLRRFREVTDSASAASVELGSLHAASSNGVYHLPEAHLDLVRPGIALFGGYPSRPDEERAIAELQPAVSLRCRVVRVEQLRRGDGVSYGRSYVADRPVWVATLPLGHVDGYPRGAVDGARVEIGGRTYPVIGAVSASHVIVEVGDQRRVEVGDVATVLGRSHEDVYPNRVASATGTSVYDRFMHLNPSLPRVEVR